MKFCAKVVNWTNPATTQIPPAAANSPDVPETRSKHLEHANRNRPKESVNESEKENEGIERRLFNDKECENVQETDYSGDESKGTGENDISREAGISEESNESDEANKRDNPKINCNTNGNKDPNAYDAGDKEEGKKYEDTGKNTNNVGYVDKDQRK